ncbi:DNA-3-methyladenine glycosylase family protein [Ureibacillus sinduriensis]|uniref:DNA-3-methyladenine glycosylase II n=1 Tax=Ureibacillus sinduriensis BLB-1 = JCM 15800 TaxID=1384057 RepID=A0A0A3HY35_9BACL|nr:DNA-3-methyladenine glycosylase [Ureibacillus sinduriensis]KGR76150.1 DNA-3-methyladenine glycosylase [Ureibacillus sinduriensis BLB-1 = JCM 15800]
MNWNDYHSYIEITPPQDFTLQECLVFLGRSEHENLHQIRDGYLYKLIKIKDELVLLKIGEAANLIRVEFPASAPTLEARRKAATYLWEWFDLSQELEPFYEMASSNMILHKIVDEYRGLRLIGIPDLFEALTWAILGQQINLAFAYTLKKRFVEEYGESLTFEGSTYWLFPEYKAIANCSIGDLKMLQFSTRKAEYIIGIAQLMTSGKIRKEDLLHLKDYQQIKQSLTAIRGVGAWTADYVMMKCLHFTSAFPIADVGLHNALKIQLGLERKPTLEEIEVLAKNWEGWQAYATFYLWRSLYG